MVLILNNIFIKFNNAIRKIKAIDNVSLFAIAVSGGSDSLALCLLMNQWAENNNKKLVAITIDHELRSESYDEAIKVKKILESLGIKHKIISWSGNKPKSNLQEKARIARYTLLTDYCHQNDIECLVTGHQRNDQAENFIIRAEHGSGVYGLSGIPKVSEFNKKTIIRPLIDFHREELQNFLISKNISWIEDPSNKNERFARVRARNFLNLYPQWIDKLANISDNLSKTKECIEYMLEHSMKELVEISYEKALLALDDFNQLPQEIRFRMILNILLNIGSKEKPARSERIEGLLEKISKGKEFKASTLGGCLISRKKDQLVITPEKLI